MSTETYLSKDFFQPLAGGWDDLKGGQPHTRAVHVCANVVTAEEKDNFDDDDVIVVYGKNGEGEFQTDLCGKIPVDVGYDVAVFLPDNPALSRFQERFLLLVSEQPVTGRLRLDALPRTAYNEDLRAHMAQWRVLVRA